MTEFIYLDHTLSSTNNCAAAVQHRIGFGWETFQKHKHILTSDHVPYHIKNKVYNTYILPVVLYGLDCVNWTNTLLSKIETFQNHIMRFMTNNRLTDHIKIQTLLEKTGLIPIVSVIKSKTLRLFAHIKRSEVGLSKVCLEGMISGKRSRSAPHKRWKDNIFDWTDLDLNSLNKATQDRELWKALSHVRAHSAASGDSDLR